MKLLHLSDLHIGKRVNGFSMLEDQRHILGQIAQLALAKGVHGVLIAGDLYDKPVPPAEAVGLLDEFFTDLAQAGIPVFAISGNHDSPERLRFGTRLMAGRASTWPRLMRGFGRRSSYGMSMVKSPFTCCPTSDLPFFGTGTLRPGSLPMRRPWLTPWPSGRLTQGGETCWWLISLSPEDHL